MKKLLLIGFCCLCLCGCNNNWEEDFQTSEIKMNIVKGISRQDTYISYTIKNISNFTCNSMKATIEFQSGNLTVEEIVYPSIYSSSPLKQDKSMNFENVIMNKNYDGYTAKFKNIDCYSKERDTK